MQGIRIHRLSFPPALTDNSTTKLLGVLDDISTQYQSTLENLHLINSSVGSMLGLVAGMDAAVSSRLEWLVAQMGGTQDGLRVLTACATHACFLLIATLCVLFIKVSDEKKRKGYVRGDWIL